MSSSNKIRVTSECPNSPCNGSVYEWRLQKLKETTGMWENITILPNITSTAVNATDMVIKKNSLQSNSKYILFLIVTSREGTEGFAALEFETAGAPHSGHCEPSISEGVALKTEFSFKCFGWKDKSRPITYEFRLGDDPLSYGRSSKSASTVLPAGQPADDFKLEINIIIKNNVGVAVVETLFVKVNNPSYFIDYFSHLHYNVNARQFQASLQFLPEIA